MKKKIFRKKTVVLGCNLKNARPFFEIWVKNKNSGKKIKILAKNRNFG